jgi:hypothetical protein
MYVAPAEALDEPLRTGERPLARAVAGHTGVTVDLVA